MALADPFAPADPLEARPAPERVNYATGMMLQADDFAAEQTYHRGRLAQLLRYLLGSGTLAGLKVVPPGPGDSLLELKVEPGIAIDRYGRMIEIGSAQCIKLASWFVAQDGRYLRAATHDAPRTPLPQAVVADVFLSAEACGRGKTPSFASGPFDALDALVPARIGENGHLELVLRMEGNPDPGGGPGVAGDIPVPENFWPGDTSAVGARNAVLASWDIGFSTNAGETLDGQQEHVPGHDPSAVLLGRVMIPVTLDRSGPATLEPELDTTQPVQVDQTIRPIIYFPGKWLGFVPA